MLEETTDTQQIHVLQNDSDRSSSTPNIQNELINNIHQKVTNYILKQIDTQLDKLDIMNDTGVKPSPCQKTTPDNYARKETEQIPTTEQAQARPFKHPDLVTQNKPTLFIPNGQMLHNLHGPPVQYMHNDFNRAVRTPYQLTKPTMRSSTRNSRTPWSTANMQRTRQKSSLTDKKKPVNESRPVEEKSPGTQDQRESHVSVNEEIIVIDDASSQVNQTPFRETPGRNRPEITLNKANDYEHNIEHSEMKICSYNWKNIKTCGLAINELFKNHQIILVQEHWLFSVSNPAIRRNCRR